MGNYLVTAETGVTSSSSDVFDVVAVTGVDASTLDPGDAHYHKRWEDSAGALHTVINITVSLGAIGFPRTVTIVLSGTAAPGWQGSVVLHADNTVVQLGLPNTKTDGVYPPVDADASWTATVFPGNVPDGTDPTTSSITSAAFTVPAPSAPSSTVATGAFIDTLIINKSTGKWGWNNLFTTLPFDPDAAPGAKNPLKAPLKASRWTVQNGHYTTSGDPSTFVAGSYVIDGHITAQHEGKEVPFDDLNGNVYRIPGSDKVTIQNNSPSELWDIPPYKLSDNTINPDNVFRFRHLMGSYLAASTSNDTTWSYENDWSTGVGDSTPGTNAYLDVVFDLANGKINAFNLDPATKAPGQVIPLGQWMQLDGTNNVTLSTSLSSLVQQIANNGYTIPDSLLKDQSILTYSVASQAVTYASGALAANALVDSNVASVSIGKLISGTTVFASDVYLARGSSQPVVRLGNDGLYFYGQGATSGAGVTPGASGNPTYSAVGLTSSPYAVVSYQGVFLYQGGSGPSTTITGGALTLYSVSGSNSFPYLTLTSGALAFNSGGNFSTSISSTQIQMLYTGASGVANTLSSAGNIIQNGSYFNFTTSTGILIGKGTLSLPATLTQMQASTQYVLIGDPGSGFEVDIVNGSYSFKAQASGLYLLYSGGPAVQLLNTGLTLYSVNGDTTKPYTVLNSTSFTLYAGSSGANVALTGSSVKLNLASGAKIELGNVSNPDSVIITSSGGSSTIITGNTIATGTINVPVGTVSAAVINATSTSYANAPLRVGGYYLWVDGSGNLRIKSSAPSSDTDGTVVGTQT